MKVKVNQDKCIGCGACMSVADDLFQFDDDGFSYAVKEEVAEKDEEKVKTAAQVCPTEAIEVEN